MKQLWTRWLDSDVGHSFRSSPVAMAAAVIAEGYLGGATPVAP